MSPPQPDASVVVDLVGSENFSPPLEHARLETLVRSLVTRELGPGEYTLSLHLVDDEEIRALNAEHRGTDTHTDVLSFPLHDPNGMRFVLPPGVPANLG